MESGFVKIIECFNITAIGLIMELQHNENGIPPNTHIINEKTKERWIIKKRVLSGTLLIVDSETYFDCETEYQHISSQYKTKKDREIAIQKELEKRKNGIYWYLLIPENKKQKVKPEIGSIFKIYSTIENQLKTE